MPVPWPESQFVNQYQIRVRDPSHPKFGQVLGYTREGMSLAMDPYSDEMTLYAHRWERIVSLWAPSTTERILIAGAAFGWLVEAAHDAGYANVWGIDNSDYVANAKNNESLPGQTEMRGDVVVVERDFTGGGAIKNALRQATGDDQFDRVISEDVLTSISDAELPGWLAAAESVLYTIQPQNAIHLSTVIRDGGIAGDSALYWHTLQGWADLAKAAGYSHTFVDISTWETIVS